MKKRFARQNIIKLSNYKRKCEMKKKTDCTIREKCFVVNSYNTTA